jgi:hypothetical protein
MNCYNHPEKDAVAICRACGKAVCRKCGLETENGIACQQSCANQLAKQEELNSTFSAHLKSIKRLNFLGSLFSIVMGLLFMYFSTLGYGIVYDFVFLLGGGFTFYGVVVQFVNLVIFFKARN